MSHSTFHFSTHRTSIRYHIARRLLALGWHEAPLGRNALFSDKNMILNDNVSKNIEYKHLLAQCVQKHCEDIMPLTYSVNDENYPHVFAKIIYQHYMKNQQYIKENNEFKWILKPALLNNGDQIKLFHHIEELKKYYQMPSRLGGDHVVQRYITNPDLIEGRKYTFRVMGVLTNYAGVFLYKAGYVNISAYPFQLKEGFANRKMHITNYVLDGELSHIEQRYSEMVPQFNIAYPQMINSITRLIKGVLKSAPFYLKPQSTRIAEIFGFDFMLDQNGKLWLLEVNQGPDAPMYEDNPLTPLLWEPFWQDIVEEFVVPIALGGPPKRHYRHFTQLLTAKESYSFIQHQWFKVRRGSEFVC